jgi:SNF2 family DNA or RNA helicase
VIRSGADKLIHKAVKPYVLRLQAEDYLELPDIIENDVPVELPGPARKAYNEMEKEAFALLDAFVDGDADNFLNTEHAAAARNKARQIANGGVYNDGKKWVHIHDAKMEALESIIEERGGKPVLVAYEFAHDYERACQFFKDKFPRIGGGVSARKTDDLVTQWNNGDIPVFWVHPAAAGHGLNMQGCDTADCIVWFAPPDDLELYDQLNARLRRQGSKIKKLVIHRLIAVETFDVAGVRRLHSKADVQTSLLDALKAYRRTRLTNH